MEFFPAFLKLSGKPVLVVGGGNVALRKAELLARAGARLTVVAPDTVDGIQALAAAGKARLIHRVFRPGDVRGKWLAVSATGDPTVERCVARAAERHRIFCNAVDDPANCSYITPAIVDRSPLLVAVSSAGNAPVLARRIRARIEVMLSRSIGDLARLAGRWRDRVAATIGDFDGRRHFWERVFDGKVEAALEGGDVSLAERRIADLLAAGTDDARPTGIAWLTGAGPGNPGLLTVDAVRALQEADVVLYDRLVSGEVLSFARRDAELVLVGKRPGCRATTQEAINSELVRLVAAGKRVCRLKGGDPFIFGRGGEEVEALEAHGLPYSVIPGITAAAGCAAAAGVPLTHRDAAQSVVLVTAHGKQSIDTLDWRSLARDRQTLAVYMGVHRFPDLMRELTAHGRSPDTPVVIIERGTLPGQRVIRGTLGQLAMLSMAHRVAPPAMLIIGEVARRGREACNETRRLDPVSYPSPAVNSGIQTGGRRQTIHEN